MVSKTAEQASTTARLIADVGAGKLDVREDAHREG